ncbi:prepilin-type N-terminal cleavage/methylation domain-containing protein [Chlamydiota bacterium]
MKCKNNTGISLIEVVLVIIIVGIVGAVLATIISQGVYEYIIVKDRITALEKARIALRKTARDIRMLDEKQIWTADYDELEFRNVFGNEVHFEFSNNILNRNNDPLSFDVVDFTFTYYDKENNILGPFPLSQSDIDALYWILIKIQITTENQTVFLRTQVFPRDIK